MNEDSGMDDLSDLLDAERDIEAPPADVQARMLARLSAALPLGAPKAGPSSGGSVTSGAAGKVLYSALLLAIGAIGGAGAHAAMTAKTSANEAPAVVSAAPVIASVEVPRAPPEAPAAAPAPSSVTPLVASVTSASATAAGDERARGKAQLKTERLLLEAAQTALRGGDMESALGALRRHARDFPRGQLVEERELMMVQVLNASGDDAAARRLAAEFKKQFPGSLMQGAVDQASKEPKP